MEITGNADQRGTEKYNEKLGQQRADAVKDHLVRLGVNADRLQARSYGKNRPKCTENNVNCYTENRRVDLQAMG